MIKIIVLILLGPALIYYSLNQQKCKVVDNQTFCIKPESDKTKYETLQYIDTNLEKIVLYVKEKYPNKSITKSLVKRYDETTKLSELIDTEDNVAYSKNKGEEIAICLEDKNIDKNTMMFVCIHELSHIGTNEIGHTRNFWKNMKFLLECAVKLNIYVQQDYSKNPVTFCDYKITSSPLYKKY